MKIEEESRRQVHIKKSKKRVTPWREHIETQSSGKKEEWKRRVSPAAARPHQK